TNLVAVMVSVSSYSFCPVLRASSSGSTFTFHFPSTPEARARGMMERIVKPDRTTAMVRNIRRERSIVASLGCLKREYTLNHRRRLIAGSPASARIRFAVVHRCGSSARNLLTLDVLNPRKHATEAT